MISTGSSSCALTVPCETSIVDDDVNLAVAELRRPLDQAVNVLIAEDIAGDGGSLAPGLVDAVGDLLGLVCEGASSASQLVSYILWAWHTFIDV